MTPNFLPLRFLLTSFLPTFFPLLVLKSQLEKELKCLRSQLKIWLKLMLIFFVEKKTTNISFIFQKRKLIFLCSSSALLQWTSAGPSLLFLIGCQRMWCECCDWLQCGYCWKIMGGCFFNISRCFFFLFNPCTTEMREKTLTKHKIHRPTSTGCKSSLTTEDYRCVGTVCAPSTVLCSWYCL